MVNIITKELHFDEELKKKIKTRDDRIEKLEYDLDDANATIDELEDKVSKLQEAISYFKELWRKIIEFLQDKFFSSNKYDEIVNELYHENIIDDNDLDIIQNEYKTKKKDDIDMDL